MITCASFLAPPHMSLTTFFFCWGRMVGSRSTRVYKRRGEEAKNSEVCWDLKTFSSTATKGAGTIIHKDERAQLLSRDPTNTVRWDAVLWAGWGSMGLCSSDSQVSAGNKLKWCLCEADCAEHLLERQESHEMTITFPGKGSNHQTTDFLEGDTPMPANRAVLFCNA